MWNNNSFRPDINISGTNSSRTYVATAATTSVSPVHQRKKPINITNNDLSKRTEGDGMENERLNDVDNRDPIIQHKFKMQDRIPGRVQAARSPIANENSLTSKIQSVKLVSSSVISPSPHTMTKAIRSTRSKEPKFVPHEPYKAATTPHITSSYPVSSISQPNDIVAEEASAKLDSIGISSEPSSLTDQFDDETNSSHENNDDEKRTLKQELEAVKREKTNLENEIALQRRVNAEIKKLLIAAVGEDIETKVESLTHDKLHLAERLLNTAKSLSTHQEQIEWLAGQCQVWKSKFLASSMLIEDLAKWKAILSDKVGKYEEAVRNLLSDNDSIRSKQSVTFENLSTLQEKFDFDAKNSHSKRLVAGNIIEFSSSNLCLSEALVCQLLHEPIDKHCALFESKDCLTTAEKYANQILSEPIVSPKDTDRAYHAVMTGAALALSAASPHCSHCTGEISTI